MNEQGGRFDIPGVRDRRKGTHPFAGFLVPWSAIELALFGARDIGRAVVAQPIRNSRSGNCSREAIRLGNDPIGQKSAVGIAARNQVDGAVAREIKDV